MAFTPDEDKFVTFAHGEGRFYKLPSGEPWEPEVKQRFPFDEKREVDSHLVHDAQGSLFVLIRDWHNQSTSVRDLWSGAEQCSLNRGHVWYLTDFLLDGEGTKTQLREIPSGKLFWEFTKPDPKNGFGDLTCTPDGRTVVHIDGKIRVWRDGEEATLDLAAHQCPALSPDGRLLATRVFRDDSNPKWLKAILEKIGLNTNNHALVIYDLSTGHEVATMRHADLAHFSRVGTTLAVTTANSLELYDLPLRRPWGKIVGLALACACIVLLAGRWLCWRRNETGVSSSLPIQGITP